MWHDAFIMNQHLNLHAMHVGLIWHAVHGLAGVKISGMAAYIAAYY